MAFHFVAATDNNSVGPLSCMMRSVITSNRHLDPIVHVLESGLSEDHKSKLLVFSNRLGLQVHFFDIALEKLPDVRSHLNAKHLPVAALYRCLMESVLPADIDRVLYLDVDTLVLLPLDELVDFELNGNVAAVAREPMSHLGKYGVSEEQYFNSGVMLIDLVEWRRQNTGQTALEYLQNVLGDMLWKDQCALNLSLKDKTADLEKRFNYMERDGRSNPSFYLPNILHFAGATKPWIDPQTLAWGIVYCKVSEGTPWPIDYYAQKRSDEEAFRRKSWIRRRIIRAGRKLARI